MAERTVNTADLNKQDKVLFNAAERMRETVTVPGAPVGDLAGAELPKKPSGGIDWTIAVDRDKFDGSSSFDPTETANNAREATDPDNLPDLPDADGFGKIKLILVALLIVVSAGQLGKLLSFEVGS